MGLLLLLGLCMACFPALVFVVVVVVVVFDVRVVIVIPEINGNYTK